MIRDDQHGEGRKTKEVLKSQNTLKGPQYHRWCLGTRHTQLGVAQAESAEEECSSKDTEAIVSQGLSWGP